MRDCCSLAFMATRGLRVHAIGTQGPQETPCFEVAITVGSLVSAVRGGICVLVDIRPRVGRSDPPPERGRARARSR